MDEKEVTRCATNVNGSFARNLAQTQTLQNTSAAATNAVQGFTLEIG